MDHQRRIEQNGCGHGVERDIDGPADGARDVEPLGAAQRDTTGRERRGGNVRPLPETAGELTARIAGSAQGAVRRSQLLDAGMTRHVLQRRALTGELHRIHRGVYIAGHLALAPLAREAAALLACGDGALISHRTAAHMWGLLTDGGDGIHVTLVGRRCRPKDGIRIHLATTLDECDRRTKHGIVLTAPARTVIDFAADADDDELEAAVSEARALKVIADGDLESALERAGCRHGVARVRRLLQSEDDHGYTRSKAERLMRRLARQGGFAQPLCNRRLHGYNVDFLWPAERLVVEVDGYQFHGHRRAFERDRKKDQVLVAAGYRIIRVTWLQLRHEPIRIAAAIAAALAAGRTRG